MSTDLAIIVVSALLAMAIVLARLGFDWIDRVASRRRRSSRSQRRRPSQAASAEIPSTSRAMDEPTVATISRALDQPAPTISRAMDEPPVATSRAMDEPAPAPLLQPAPAMAPPAPPVPVARAVDEPVTAHPLQPQLPEPSVALTKGTTDATANGTNGEPSAWRLPPAAALASPSSTVEPSGPRAALVSVAAAAIAPDPLREDPPPATPAPGLSGPAPAPDVERRRGGLSVLLDESVGMYAFRRLFRRPTSTRAQRQFEEASTLVATQRLHREFGIEPVQQAHPIQSSRIVVSGSSTGASPVAASVAVAGARRRPSQRAQLARDGAIAFAMFGVIAVLVVGFVSVWPGGDGAVLGATGTPAASPAGAGASSASPTLAPSPSPTIAPTPTPTPAPTASPSPTPAPTATPSPTPAPTRQPAATASNQPAPDPTAAPPAAATATPKPTPKPTAKPTPTPAPPLVAFPSCSASGFTVSCQGSASRSGAIYVWAFNGQNPTGPSVSHTYAEPGTYTITLTVIVGDDQASESLSITVPQ